MIKREDLFIRDPFVYVEDDVAYLVGTTDRDYFDGPAQGYLGYKTTDLENFEGPYELFKVTPDFWGEKNCWACELHKVRGKYYLSASCKGEVHPRAGQIFVSDAPFGKYTPIQKPFTPEGWECLDPTLYEEDGKLYTVFCHEWLQCHDGEIVLGELNDTLDGLKGEPTVLFRASEAPWSVGLNGGKDFITDGPFLYPLKSGKLLMLWTSRGENNCYKMGMAVSERGVKGPWRQYSKPLYEEDGGAGMIFNFRGKKYLSLHKPDAPMYQERAFFYEIEETEDGVVIK